MQQFSIHLIRAILRTFLLSLMSRFVDFMTLELASFEFVLGKFAKAGEGIRCNVMCMRKKTKRTHSYLYFARISY